MTKDEFTETSIDELLGKLEEHTKWYRENCHLIDHEKALEQGIQVIKEDLKEEYHADCIRRVQLAVERHWSEFYFWTYEGESKPYELFGMNPETGHQEQVPFFKGEQA